MDWLKMWAILFVIILAGCASKTGSGTVPSNDVEIPPGISRPDASDRAIDKIDDKQSEKGIVTLHAVGKGIAPENAISRGQAIILGQSAARADGYVRLAEKIHGVYIESYRRIGRGYVDIEMVHQETQAWLRGAEVLEYKQVEHGIFEAYIRVRIIVDKDHALYPIRS